MISANRRLHSLRVNEVQWGCCNSHRLHGDSASLSKVRSVGRNTYTTSDFLSSKGILNSATAPKLCRSHVARTGSHLLVPQR